MISHTSGAYAAAGMIHNDMIHNAVTIIRVAHRFCLLVVCRVALVPCPVSSGHWNYNRIALVVLFSFYKDVLYNFTQLWWTAFTPWSGQKYFVEMANMTINLVGRRCGLRLLPSAARCARCCRGCGMVCRRE